MRIPGIGILQLVHSACLQAIILVPNNTGSPFFANSRFLSFFSYISVFRSDTAGDLVI